VFSGWITFVGRVAPVMILAVDDTLGTNPTCEFASSQIVK
jgi:hypothetical protein